MRHLRFDTTLTFHVPPTCQGQIVEIAYAFMGDVVVRRTTDTSDQSVTFEVADAATVDGDDPWNQEPTAPAWERCDVNTDVEG